MSASQIKTSSSSERSEVIIYTFENKPFRVVGSLDNPHFVVKDICDILGISNATMAIKNIPKEWQGDLYQIEDTIGRLQHMNTVYESGVYYLIMRSDKEVAKPFQKWVCEDVLTSLRKKGEYILQEYKEKLEAQQKLLEEKEAETKAQQKLLVDKQAHIKILENKTLKQQTRVKYAESNVVYLLTSKYHLPERIYIIGKGVDLTHRLSTYNKSLEHEVVYIRECNSAQQMSYVEKMVLSKLDKYREVAHRDRFILPLGKDISLFTDAIDILVDYLSDVDSGVDIKKVSKYREENKEEILTKSKIKVECECGAKVVKQCLKRHMESSIHKSLLKAKENPVPEPVKEEKTSLQYDKIECECGLKIAKPALQRHKKSKVHESFLKERSG
jgi:prophage antirepressor-like protein